MRFCKFYRAIAWEPRISMSAKAALSTLKQYANADHQCWPARKTLMKDLACSNRTLTLALNELRLWGIVEWEKGFSGKANIYTLHDEKVAAAIERGEVSLVSTGVVPLVSTNENHSKGATVKEEPRAYGT